MQGRIEDSRIFDDKPTVLGEEPRSVRRANIETCHVTFGVIMRPKNGTLLSQYPRMRHPK
jgi:hypothetical protein